MAQDTVVLTHWVHSEVIDLLASRCRVLPNQTRESLPRQEILRRARSATGLMVFMPDLIDEAFLAACPRLRVVAAALKGYDNFDLAACTRRGVWLCIVPDLLTVPTAELALALLLGLTRRVLEGDRLVRSGRFAGCRPQLYGRGLSGATLGLIGLGAVGKALVRRLAGFELKLIYYDRRRLPPAEESALGVKYGDLGQVLAQSDFVLPLLPLNGQTFHLIDRVALRAMKPGAFLVNVCRGSVVDENAVIRSLADGRLEGYAADVFEMEDWALPGRPRQIDPQLRHHPRTLFTPHLGSAVDSVRREIALRSGRDILQALAGQRPAGAINHPCGPQEDEATG